MSPGLQRKLEQLAERHEEVGRLLAEPEVLADNNRFRTLSREFAQLEPVAGALAQLSQAQRDLEAARAMRNDPEMRELAEEEIPAAEARIAELDERLQLLLIPVDPRDEGNLFLEVRAGTGGDEAAIFAGDLFRMYARFAERQRWKLEVLSSNPGEHGGFKEIVARIEGRGAYSKLKFESGTHRVQRVPDTETQGRIHTSAATVAILPDYEEVSEVVINPADLRVDTYRSSGAGVIADGPDVGATGGGSASSSTSPGAGGVGSGAVWASATPLVRARTVARMVRRIMAGSPAVAAGRRRARGGLRGCCRCRPLRGSTGSSPR